MAKECRQEAEILKKIAPQCIEDTGGLFVAVEGDDEKYVADFPHLCERCGMPVKTLDISEALELEPGQNLDKGGDEKNYSIIRMKNAAKKNLYRSWR